MKKLIIILIGVILSSLSAFADNFAVETTPNLRVWAEFPDTIYADGETVFYIRVYEHDDEDVEYTAFNMEFILPEGFKVNQVKEGRREVNDIHLTERADATHSISCNLKNGIDLRIIATSSENANFFSDDEEGNPLDELFTVGLIAEPSLATGEYTATMEGIKFCLKNADARIPAETSVSYILNVVNKETSDIDEMVDSSYEKNEIIHDLQGRRVANPLTGLYIINGKKVIK